MKTSSLLAALAALTLVSPVAAQSVAGPSITVAAPVRTADLDLATTAGRRTLDARIRQAVAVACGDASSADLKGGNEVRRCRADALRRASGQAAQAALAARPATAIAALDE